MIEYTLFSAHDPVLLQKWRKAVVGIAGAGGLGSNIAISLVRAGIGKLIIADFDTVSITNLNRQQYFLDQLGQPKVSALKANLERISISTQIDIHQVKIEPASLNPIFGECVIMIEAFDSADQKRMLIEAWTELYPERPIIAASGLAGIGQNDRIKQQKFGNIYICGDFETELEDGISPMAPRVAIVANMQANLCLELLSKGDNL